MKFPNLIPNKIFTEFAMEPPKDKLYIRPIYTKYNKKPIKYIQDDLKDFPYYADSLKEFLDNNKNKSKIMETE